jgi:hypothetical protein
VVRIVEPPQISAPALINCRLALRVSPNCRLALRVSPISDSTLETRSTRCTADQFVQQCRLAHARLTDQHKRPALTCRTAQSK